jgi:hypothetical protein
MSSKGYELANQVANIRSVHKLITIKGKSNRKKPKKVQISLVLHLFDCHSAIYG